MFRSRIAIAKKLHIPQTPSRLLSVAKMQYHTHDLPPLLFLLKKKQSRKTHPGSFPHYHLYLIRSIPSSPTFSVSQAPPNRSSRYVQRTASNINSFYPLNAGTCFSRPPKLLISTDTAKAWRHDKHEANPQLFQRKKSTCSSRRWP